MSNLHDIPPEMQPVEPVQTGRGTASFWYSVMFVLMPVVALAVFVCIPTRTWFLSHDDYPMLKETLGYSLRARGVNCEVVVFGDSSTLTAIDPAIIEARTGLTTCNLSELRPVQWTVGSYFPLDQYLAHNQRPKILFSQWTAYEFHPETKAMANFQSEGLVYGMLYDRAVVWRGFSRHPRWLILFGLWVENRLISDFLGRNLGVHQGDWSVTQAPRDERKGFWQYPLKAETHCLLPNDAHPLNRDETVKAIGEFKARYAVDGTQVVVNISPAAECVANRAKIVKAADGLGDNKLEFLPVGLFNATDVHFTPEGSRVMSEKAANQILTLLNRGQATGDGESAKKGTPQP